MHSFNFCKRELNHKMEIELIQLQVEQYSFTLGPWSLEALLFEIQYIEMVKPLKNFIDFIVGTTFYKKC